MLIAVYIISKKRGYKGLPKASNLERWQAFKKASFALVMPAIILGGIYGGVFTPTEAAAVAVSYALFVGFFIYRELNFHRLLEALKVSTITTAIIMFIIANAGLFGWILSREGIPQMVGQFLVGISDNPIIFLLIINMALLIAGMFMETGASIIILAPILTPVAVGLGIDPVHFGIIMIVNLAIGMCTPPLGVNLFISCQIADVSLERLALAVIPLLMVLILNLLVLSYFPQITLWLPSVLD